MKTNFSQLLIGAILGLATTLQAQFFYLANERPDGISASTTAFDRIVTSVGLIATGSAPLCVAVETVASLLHVTKRAWTNLLLVFLISLRPRGATSSSPFGNSLGGPSH
ncbi:MAG: hypothetical protein JO279_14515 [Verrucomicrobia bacterium]|nr:hypothetical protein [Verrucomicrobiota bacterium]